MITLRQRSVRLRSILNSCGLYCGKERVLSIHYCETTLRIFAKLERSGLIPVVSQGRYEAVIQPTPSGEILKSGDGNDRQIWRLTNDARSEKQ